MAISDSIVLNSLSSVRRIEDEFTRALENTMRQLERNMQGLLDNAQQVSAVDAALARQEIQNTLINSGYFETTGRLLNEGYQAAIEEAQRFYFESIGENFQFAETSLQRLNALKEIDLGEYAKLSNDFTTNLTRTLVDLNFGSVDMNQAVGNLQSAVDQLNNHARTWITTGLSAIYTQSSTMLATDNGISKFIYVGPVDTVTRPFCRNHINQTKTLQQWDKLDNGQILPVSQFRGGFNCRHALVGVK
jgi:hypothetical protein